MHSVPRNKSICIHLKRRKSESCRDCSLLLGAYDIMIVLKSFDENIVLPCKRIFKNVAFEASILACITYGRTRMVVHGQLVEPAVCLRW